YSRFPSKVSELPSNENAELINISLGKDVSEKGLHQIRRLDDFVVSLKLKLRNSFSNPYVAISIYDKEQRPVGICQNTKGLGQSNIIMEEGDYVIHFVSVTIPR